MWNKKQLFEFEFFRSMKTEIKEHRTFLNMNCQATQTTQVTQILSKTFDLPFQILLEYIKALGGGEVLPCIHFFSESVAHYQLLYLMLHLFICQQQLI